MPQCYSCKKEVFTENVDFIFSDNGNEICESCQDENCMRCLEHLAEVETRRGDYICSHCYSGDIDRAYDLVHG